MIRFLHIYPTGRLSKEKAAKKGKHKKIKIPDRHVVFHTF